MPLFLSEEEYERCSQDAAAVAEKADEFIRELSNQHETVKAQADAAAITAEQTCSLLEQKYVSLSSEFAKLESQNSTLRSSLEQRLSELAQIQADKHQIQLKLIAKEGAIERSSAEAWELHKSKRRFIELLEQKEADISEKNALIKTYLDKIVNLTDSVSSKEARLNEVEAELSRSNASCTRLSQEKELVERHNIWLNDELTNKVNSLTELRKAYGELEADMSSKIADLERRLSESSSSLKWNKDKVMDLEMKLTSLQEDLSSCKDAAAANEERYSAEMATVNKLVELYKESSQEWSKKAGELEGVIRALETHSSQVENDYKEEISARKDFEKEAAQLKGKLEKCEAELETSRTANELNLLPLSSTGIGSWLDSVEENDIARVSQRAVPNVPLGVSGTALAASLLRDGWSLAKIYTKYQEAVDAFRHEQLGRKQSQAILERVLYEIEEKAGIVMDERAEHEKLVEAYSLVNQKLQHSLSEQNNLERTILELKADLRRSERDYSIAHKEIVDLQKQVTILLKECRDLQLRCGSVGDAFGDETSISIVELNAETDAEKVISERLLTFKDIHGLVEQNVQLRSLLRRLSEQIENTEMELKERFEMEIHKHDNEAAAKVNAVLVRAEEQGRMIESLHTSVAMYKRLYEEEHKRHSPYPHTTEANPGSLHSDDGRKNLVLLLEGSQEATKKAQEEAFERVRCLEDNLGKLRSEMLLLRSERDKLAAEAEFAREKLDRFMKEFEHQRDETNAVISRNVEFSQLIINYQRKLRESSESVHAAEELSGKLNMEVSLLKHEKEMFSNSEKRACDEVRSLSARVYRLQASLDTIQSTEEVREEVRRAERGKQEKHVKQIEREWAEAKKELQEERENVRRLTLEREEIMKNTLRQVEEMGKELSNSLSAVAAAEARAAVAEARCSDMEKKIKSPGTQIARRDGEQGVSSLSANEALTDLHIAREEIEKLREEAQINKDHMLQYKNIAQVNEDALNQIELAHENFKIEADKARMSLEADLVSMKEQIRELECEHSSKSKEAASSIAERQAALNSALSEIDQLKQENSIKMSQIATLEIQVSTLKEDLDKGHRRWRDAQTNYERQVILQSETIQELTKTSEALALLQEETAELRKLSDALKTENCQLKARWDSERLMLEESKNVAEKKYNEINEQNKILHNRLEALHIKLAEKDRNFAGISSESIDQDPLHDAGLQNVVNYLRRSKEIAETEISLLKQEKLRMQLQLESALKAAESAQATLHAVRENSRKMSFTEEEFNSLKLQVREINLLRESNVQLREENKHNFEECQKLREVAHQARMETEKLDSLLREKQTEVEACKKEVQLQKMEKELLEKKVDELLERCRNNVDVEDYNHMRDNIKEMQANLNEKDALLEEIKKLLAEKEAVTLELEKELAKSRKELSEREGRLNESLQVEVSLKSEIEKQKKLLIPFKKKLDNLSKEKEELSKLNQALSKQLEEFKQGRKSTGDAEGEQAMKEKEKEKDTRIQMLEKTVERQREELKKEKDDHKTEKARRLKTQKAIWERVESVNQEKSKLVEGLENHKQAVKRLEDEVEKLKNAKNSLPEGNSVVQILSGTLMDDLSAAFILAVENFERVAHLVSGELGEAPAQDSAPVGDASSSLITSGQAVPLQAPSILPTTRTNTSSVSAKPAEEREKKFPLPITNNEPRKTGRKFALVRTRIKKPEAPQGDTEMPEVEKSNNDEKPVTSQNLETKEIPTQMTHTTVRKRLAHFSSEPQEESLVQHGASSDVEAPVVKKFKGSDLPQESSEGHISAGTENLESPPCVQEPSDALGDRPQGSIDESIDTEKDDTETGGEQDDDQKMDNANQVELQSESNNVLEEMRSMQNESEGSFDDGLKAFAEQEMQQSVMESGSEREEGELLPDVGDVDGGNDMVSTVESQEMGEDQPEHAVPSGSSPSVDDETIGFAKVDATEASIQALNDEGDVTETNEEGADNLNDGNNQDEAEADENPEAVPDTTVECKKEESQNSQAISDMGERSSTNAVIEAGGSKEGRSGVTAETQEVKQSSPVGKSPTTINLNQRAKERSLIRQQGRPSTPPGRGRGRIARGRGGRGQSSGGGRG